MPLDFDLELPIKLERRLKDKSFCLRDGRSRYIVGGKVESLMRTVLEKINNGQIETKFEARVAVSLG